MHIEITFMGEDIEKIAAEHCREQFRIDPRSVEIGRDGPETFVVRVSGDYDPEIGKA